MRKRLRCGLAAACLAALPSLAGCAGAERPVRTAQVLRAEPPLSLAVPVDGVAAARLRDSWGDARDGGRTHQGIDIFAPRGTPVRSTTDGVIESKGMRGLGGRVVTVMGPGGYRHYYAHLEDWGPQRPGDLVRRGEVIGFVGDSGNAAWKGTHLHYGIYAPSGRAINPYPLLQGAGDRRTLSPATGGG